MVEKIYHTMKAVGIGNLIMGIITILLGCFTGAFMIVNGVRLLKKKSDFAFSLLYIALSKNIDWKMPLYIKNALEWIQNDAS